MKRILRAACAVFLLLGMLTIAQGYAQAASARPETPVLEKAASYNYEKIKLTWSPVSGADGYEIFRASSESGKFKKIAAVTSPDKVTYINGGRTTGKRYWYKIRAFDRRGSSTVYSGFSKVKSAYARPVKVKELIAEWKDSGGYALSWKASKGADGYEVAVMQEGDTQWRKDWYYRYGPTYEETIFVGDIDVNGTTAAVAAGNCDYQFKVRAYRTVNGKRVYGLYSEVFTPEPEVTAGELKEAAENYIKQKYPASRLSESSWRTPENSSWGPTWPKSFSKYMSAEKILDKYLAEALDFYAESFWKAEAGGTPGGSIYVREVDNCYAVWWIA